MAFSIYKTKLIYNIIVFLLIFFHIKNTIYLQNIPVNAINSTSIERLSDIQSNWFIFTDNGNNTWISGEKGLNILDRTKIKFHVFAPNDTSINLKNIQSNFYEYKNKSLWFTTINHIIKFDYKLHTYSQFQLSYKETTLTSDYHLFYLDSLAEKLWLSCRGYLGWVSLNEPTTFHSFTSTTSVRFTPILDSNHEVVQIIGCPWIKDRGIELIDLHAGQEPDKTKINPLNLEVSKAYVEGESVLLLTNKGIARFNLTNPTHWELYEPYPNKATRISFGAKFNDNHYILKPASSSFLLFNTASNTYSELYNPPEEEIYNSAACLYNDGVNIWASFDNIGVYKYNYEWFQSLYDWQKITTDPITDIVLSSSGDVIYATSSAVFKYNENENDHIINHWNVPQITDVHILKNHILASSPYVLTELLEEGNNRPIIDATSHNYIIPFDRPINASSFYYGKRRVSTSGTSIHISSSEFLDSLEDFKVTLIAEFDERINSKDTIILLDRKQLIHLKKNDKKYRYTFPIINNIEQSPSDGNIYLCTNEGLYIYNMTLDSVFQPQNSLEASIYDITFKDTQAFILTEKGLFLFDCPNNDWEGRLASAPESNRESSIVWGNDDNIWIGTNKGLFRAHYPDLHPSSTSPGLEIVQLDVFGKEIKHFAGDTFMQLDVPFLEYRFIVRPAVISTTSQEGSFFKYKRDPGDPWTRLNSNDLLDLQFSDYKPHHLYFVPVSGDMIQGKQVHVIVTIPKPYYRTWWFIGCLIISAGGLVLLGNYLLLRRKFLNRQKAMEHQLALSRQREHIAHDLHDNLGTELSKILYLTDEVMTTEESQNHPLLKQIGQLAENSIRNMRDMLWILDERQDTLASLIEKIQSQAKQTIQSIGISLRYDYPNPLPEISLTGEERQAIYLIYKEGLFNIVKHAHASNVFLGIMQKDQELIFRLEDDGVGFDPSAGQKSGHYGLASMHDRATSIGAQFTLQSKTNQGAKIEIRFIPFSHQLT